MSSAIRKSRWGWYVAVWAIIGVWWMPSALAAEAARSTHRVEIRGEWFYVDGEQFFVKGVGYSPWRPGQLPWQERVNPAILEEDFKRIRAAGFNTIRTWTPLTRAELDLADHYGLMVIQGIWLDQQPKDYSSASYRSFVQAQVRDRVREFAGASNILLVLVGNELPVGQVYLSGKEATESFLRGLRDAVKAADPTRFVSIANWPELAFLDSSLWDAVCFNTYRYAPDSIAHSFGYPAYVRHLKAQHAPNTPFIVSEFGLSVSPTRRGAVGYGGNSLDEQARGLIEMAGQIEAAGAQGSCVFEWNDEWWKNYEHAGDEQHHDDDPEEWFGLMAIDSPSQPVGAPRPAYDAMRDRNRALLVTPYDGGVYRGPLTIAVYADDVAQVRYRLNRGTQTGAWQSCQHTSPHWWTAAWDTTTGRDAEWQVEIAAHDAEGKVVARRVHRCVTANHRAEPRPPLTVKIETERTHYVATNQLITATFDVQVTDARGRPAANVPVRYAIAEPLVSTYIQDTRTTDKRGRMRIVYNLRDPGILSCSAGVELPLKSGHGRRFGDELFVFVDRPQPPAQETPPSATPPTPLTTPPPSSVPSTPSADTSSKPPEATTAVAPSPMSSQPVAAPTTTPSAAAGSFTLYDPGTEFPVPYEQYGTFLGAGTKDYRYEIRRFKELVKAVGEGIYPNEESIYLDPDYRRRLRAKELEGDQWEYVNIDDYQLSFYRWVTAEDDPGVKMYYAAYALERAGLIQQAIKTYYAIVVHYPQSVGWTYWRTPWYVGKVALDNILYLQRTHPEMPWRLVGAKVVVEHGYDNDIKNDAFLVTPGRWVPRDDPAAAEPSVDISKLAVVKRSGKGRVQAVQWSNGHWQLRVDGKPFVVRGISYDATPVGQSPDEGTLDFAAAQKLANKLSK